MIVRPEGGTTGIPRHDLATTNCPGLGITGSVRQLTIWCQHGRFRPQGPRAGLYFSLTMGISRWIRNRTEYIQSLVAMTELSIHLREGLELSAARARQHTVFQP